MKKHINLFIFLMTLIASSIHASVPTQSPQVFTQALNEVQDYIASYNKPLTHEDMMNHAFENASEDYMNNIQAIVTHLATLNTDLPNAHLAEINRLKHGKRIS